MAASQKEAALQAKADALRISTHLRDKAHKQLNDNLRKREARWQKQGVAMSRAVWLLSVVRSRIPFEKCCSAFGLDLETALAEMVEYVLAKDDKALDDEIRRLRTSADQFSKAVRKRLLDSALVLEIDELNTAAGYAPSYTDIMLIRRQIHEKIFWRLPTPHRSDQMADQWCRRFVSRNKLSRGRIERQQHESRSQLLQQVVPG